MSSQLKPFPCDACGECCRQIDKVEGLKHLQTDGVCKYLVNNKCSIYNSRPDLCRYEKVYELFKYKYSTDEFYELSVHYCEELKKEKK